MFRKHSSIFRKPLMDRFDAMSLLVAIAEAGSLSAAGRRMGLPLTTVSRRISDLEARLNARLLIRSTRRLTLTEAGVAYVEACRRILDQVAEAERAAAGEYVTPKGDLMITAPIVFGRLHVTPVVAEFLKTFREIDVRLALTDRTLHIIDDHVDVAVRIGHLSDSGLIATRLGAVREVVCGSPDFFARHGLPRSPADLADLSAVTFGGIASEDAWMFRVNGVARPISVRSRLSVNTAEAAIDAAVAGLGVTRVLDYQIAAALAAGRLVIALADFEAPPWPVSLMHARQGQAPLKLRAFLDFAAPRLRQRLAGLSET
jgi:DNA-binding transcriptional LysR family regulator